MAKSLCIHCGRGVKLQDYVIRAVLRCPYCRQLFETSRPDWKHVDSPEPVPPIEPPGEIVAAELLPKVDFAPPEMPSAQLTMPHECHQCHQPIRDATGKRRATVNCPTCGKRTSVYAIQYRCGACFDLLESPARALGSPTLCPNCRVQLTVPHDVVECEAPRNPEEPWLCFDCPSCREAVAAPTREVGTFAVCPRCLVTLSVPRCGILRQEGVSDTAPEPWEALYRGIEVPCPRCGMKVPSKAEVCSYCGFRSKPTDSA